MSSNFVYLASASPRRRELLTQIGVRHESHPVDIDETRRPGEAPGDYVTRLAETKAETAWSRIAPGLRRPVIAADTAVVVDEEVLGKPRDREDALRMLALLSGRVHEVYTAVALCNEGGENSRVNVSRVQFRTLRPGEAERYWASGEPQDKAGSYAVQGHAAVFIERLEGSYSGVMGLPLFETAALLGQA
jgi:septum formation protein